MSVTTIGFKEFAAKMQNLSKEVLSEVDGECNDVARLWEQLAKNSAPVDTGRLRANITESKIAALNYQVSSPILYSPYQEWGTGNYVSVPAELAQYAAQFKGKRKVIGHKPHPYFFIHKKQVENYLNLRITKVLTTAR